MLLLLPILSASLGILAFLPINLWFLGFFFLVPLFIFFLKEEKFWRLILGTFIFRFILALGTVYFTLEPLTWIHSIGIFLGLPISIFLLKRGAKRVLSIVNSQWLIVLSLPFLWTFFDHLQAQYSFLPTYIITAGNIFGSSPFLGLSAIGGLILLTFFAVLINTLIAKIILNTEKRKINFIIIAIIIIMIFGSWQISKFQLHKNSTEYNALKNSLKIASISTNEKFNQQDFKQIKSTLLKSEKVDLLIFPEDIFNETVKIGAGGSQTWFKMKNLSKKLETNLASTFDTIQDQARYNSTVLFNKKGEMSDIYHKNRLTFIGEYWPFGNWRPFYFYWIKKNNPRIQDYVVFNPQNAYSRGDKKLLTLHINSLLSYPHRPASVQFASLICLEIHYPNDLKKYKKMGAQFIINPTSNRWVGLGLNHFLHLTNNLRKIEAVWLKVPIILSGVKDYAGIIMPNGKTNLIKFENENKNYGIFIGKINF